MKTTNTLLVALKVAHPNLTFLTIEKVDTAHANNPSYADTLIAVEVDEEVIFDPFLSSCERFDVDPEVTYDIPVEVARQLIDHNFPEQTASTTTAPQTI